jgi:hypothetical protein
MNSPEDLIKIALYDAVWSYLCPDDMEIAQIAFLETAGELIEQLNIGYKLVDIMIRDMPACTCSEAYTSRNMIDPSCTHCDAIEDDTYNDLVAWRNRMTKILTKGRECKITRTYEEWIFPKESPHTAEYTLTNEAGTIVVAQKWEASQWQEPYYQLSLWKTATGNSRTRLIATSALIDDARVLIDLILLAMREEGPLPLRDPLHYQARAKEKDNEQG